MFTLDHATCSSIGAVLVKGPIRSDIFNIDYAVYTLIDSAFKFDVINGTSVVSNVSYTYCMDNGKRYAFYKEVTLTLPDGNRVIINFNRILGKISYNLYHTGGVEYISINTTTYRILQDGTVYLIRPNKTNRPSLIRSTSEHIADIIGNCSLNPTKSTT